MTKAEVIIPIQHTFLDYPDPEGGALAVYFTGCQHNCMYCSNKKLQRKGNKDGLEITVEDLFLILKNESKRYKNCKKVVLLGGEPLDRTNIKFVRDFLLYNSTVIGSFEVAVYTGYTIKQLREFDYGDVLLNEKKFSFIKTGKYVYNKRCRSEKTDDYMQLGSTNQEIYDYRMLRVSSEGRMEFGEETKSPK